MAGTKVRGYWYLLELVNLASLQSQNSPLQSDACIQRGKQLKFCQENNPLSGISKQEREEGEME